MSSKGKAWEGKAFALSGNPVFNGHGRSPRSATGRGPGRGGKPGDRADPHDELVDAAETQMPNSANPAQNGREACRTGGAASGEIPCADALRHGPRGPQGGRSSAQRKPGQDGGGFPGKRAA